MKDEQLNLFKLRWTIDYFEQSDKKGVKSVYRPGGEFTIEADSCGEVGQINLKISETDKFIKLPMFMGIRPTVFENDETLYVVDTMGSDPCELHSLAMWFGGFNTNEPWFKFEVAAIYDDCVCPEEDPTEYSNGYHRQHLRSGHGIGGGTGGDPN